MISRMKELEKENRCLKKMYAELQMSADTLRWHSQKSGKAIFRR